MRLPGPPELIPGRPDAVVDLQADAGAGLVGAEWRYSDARIQEAIAKVESEPRLEGRQMTMVLAPR